MDSSKIRKQQQKEKLRESAGFVPDFAKLVCRLYRDPRVRLRTKIGLALLAAYLASPIDLVPDFIPVLGYADDVIVVVLSFGWLLRSAGSELIQEHWDGSADPVALIESMRVAVRRAFPWSGRWLS